MALDSIMQAVYGPPIEGLKYTGSLIMAISAVSGSSVGWTGLLALLASVTQNNFLLPAFLLLGGISVAAQLVRLISSSIRLPWILCFLETICQGGALWWAWRWQQGYQDDQSGYTIPDGSPAVGRQQAASSDPFEAYVPPAQNSQAYNHQGQQQNQRQSQPQAEKANQNEQGRPGELL